MKLEYEVVVVDVEWMVIVVAAIGVEEVADVAVAWLVGFVGFVG